MDIDPIVSKVFDAPIVPKVSDLNTYEFYHCFCSIEDRNRLPLHVVIAMLAIPSQFQA